MPDINDWRRAAELISEARTVFVIQLTASWLADPARASVRDDLDIAIFRAALLSHQTFEYRRFLLYDLPSDSGGSPDRYRVARVEHDDWLARVRRQLAVLGAEGSAGGSLPRHSVYKVEMAI